MANLSTEAQKRDFLSEEIRKRIVGPGFAQDVYLCNNDASDEILTERPQVVYTSGILFPKQTSGDMGNSRQDQAQVQAPDLENLFGNPYQDEDEDDLTNIPDNEESEEAGEDAEILPVSAKSDAIENGLSDERAGLTPDRIGLITCLEASTSSVEVAISYGRYRILKEDEWKDTVKVPLDDRCPINILNETFDYYDTYAQDLLNKLGVHSAHDLFKVDAVNKTISPIRELSYPEKKPSGELRKKYVFASSFPSSLRNKAKNIVCEALEYGTCELKDIKWAELEEQIHLFDSIPEVKEILASNNWNSLSSHITYNATSNSITITGTFQQEVTNLKNFLSASDPVKDYVLGRLLEYRYFKRKQVRLHIDLDLSKNSGTEDLGDGALLHWKAFSSAKKPDVRYLRVLFQNCTVVAPRSGDIPHIFQAEIRIDSDSIVSYSEPQISSIDDEFNLNEKLYADEAVFGKGVNCAVIWERSEERRPAWIKTTYTPAVKVRSFSTSTNDDQINAVCDVHNLSIWGKSDNDIIYGLTKFADNYEDWMQAQKRSAGADPELQKVIDKQDEFLKRYNDNVTYLANHSRAMRCFRMANSAMYIQMLLGRDQRFKVKSRDKSSYPDGDIFYNDCWDYFEKASSSIRPAYYPFQLAFLVMNIKSIFEPDDPYRTDKVDLIWFPTGGGKTEAYLALTALTIAERRTSSYTDTSGVSVIMRYTLRLLTAQQFERASYLICAMEYMREHFKTSNDAEYSLGKEAITLGMWIGQAAAPNKIDGLTGDYKFAKFFREKTMETNPFPIVYCPWCGCNMVGEDKSIGYDQGHDGRRKDDICLNPNCHFHFGLPIYYIDEQLYNNPPTLLFATVDKFAQLNTKKAGSLFGCGTNRRKPDLIIQDELHLISGPLGSLVGLFESLIEELATEKDQQGNPIRAPKIIASTATTRNTARLIRQLYNREVVAFPASGVKYSDNFFSHILSEQESKRQYMGISPTGHSASELEIRTIAAELVAKEKMLTEWMKNNGSSLSVPSILANLCNNGKLVPELDIYWTQVLYYINKKSLGRTHSRINQEIKATVENMRQYTETYPELDFILNGFYTRNTEFTSRQNSSQIKKLLIKADEPTTLEQPSSDGLRVDSQMDIVQATNMISVGIDIKRWNVMIMIGQPLTTAEYIQASSRCGRHHQGLVINLYNPLRSRELSFYENYTSYHQVFYKFVEPLSATTFTEMTIDKLLLNLYVGYMVLVKGKRFLKDVTVAEKDNFFNWLKNRAKSTGAQASLLTSLQSSIDNLYKKLKALATTNRSYTFSDIITKVALLPSQGLPHLMTSLRDVEQNTYLDYE